jgi:predicted nucleotidyltransferase
VAFTLTGAQEVELVRLCQQFAVRELKLFGSAVTEAFDPARSDLDFLVTFGVPPEGMPPHRQFFDFLFALEALFNRKVDLLEESAIENRRFKRAALREAVALYVIPHPSVMASKLTSRSLVHHAASSHISRRTRNSSNGLEAIRTCGIRAPS